MNNMYTSAMFYSQSDFVLADTLKRELRENGIELIYINEPHKFLDAIINHDNSLIFFDYTSFKYADIIKNLAQKSPYLSKSIVVFIDGNESRYKGIVDNLKVFWLSSKLIKSDVENIIKKRKFSYDDKLDINYSKINKELTEYLISLGFSQKYIGFNYIKDTIIKLLKMGGAFRSLHTDIYPLIAMKYNCGIVNIERNIRSVINDAKKKEDFGKTHLDIHSVTNRLFITFLLDKALSSVIDNVEIS